MTSNNPRTVIVSMGQCDSKPCAIICGPPMPWKRASGRCRRRPDSSRPASRSPDISPATTAISAMLVTSADDATAGRIEEGAEGAQVLGRVRRGQFLLQQRHLGFFQGQAGAVQGLVGRAQGVDLLAREAAPLQAFDIDAVGLGRIPVEQHEGRHVLRQAGAHADKGVGADLAELVHVGVAAHDDPVADLHVPGHLGIVREDCVAAHHAVVRQVDVGRNPVVVAQLRHALVLHRAQVEGAEFAHRVAVAHFQAGRLAVPLLVLRWRADRRELEELVVAADGRMAFDDDVRADPGTVADDDVRTHDRVRADLDALAQLGFGVDDGAGVDGCHACLRCGDYDAASAVLRMVHISSASTATWPSTLPTALYFQMPREVRRISTSIFSWSPGPTGRLKRALSMPTKYTTEFSSGCTPIVKNDRMAAVCASASIIKTPGITGLWGKWPLKNSSLTVTFLMAVIDLLASQVSTRSTSSRG